MSSLPPWGADLILGVAAVGTAAVAIGLFMRSTRSGKDETPSSEKEATIKEFTSLEPPAGMSLKAADVGRTRRELRLLALERDALSQVISKFFEAEDEGEISKEERTKLSREYEARVKALSDRFRRAELIVGLYELEKIRDELVKRFEAKLGETTAKIKELSSELKLKVPVEEKKATKKVKEKEAAEGEPKRRRKPKGSEIDEKIEKLRREVLKELEELEKLEIGV